MNAAIRMPSLKFPRPARRSASTVAASKLTRCRVVTPAPVALGRPAPVRAPPRFGVGVWMTDMGQSSSLSSFASCHKAHASSISYAPFRVFVLLDDRLRKAATPRRVGFCSRCRDRCFRSEDRLRKATASWRVCSCNRRVCVAGGVFAHLVCSVPCACVELYTPTKEQQAIGCTDLHADR